jgi:hypothetical protein
MALHLWGFPWLQRCTSKTRSGRNRAGLLTW